ncbi:MAG: hypothetical protein C0467_21600 [Planctomycetaceae bacterium]|nr:hypothetical protein [Planctomycetaceae bacterium]
MEVRSGLPFDEPNVLTLAGLHDLVEHVVLARRDGRAAEPLGELQVFAFLACVSPEDGQFCVAGSDSRKQFRHTLGCQVPHNVNERPTRADRWELPRVADHDEAVNTFQRLDEGRKHLFGQHLGFVDNDRSGTDLGRYRRDAIPTGLSVVAIRAQELDFYLAKWGMYRGSSCLLRYAYTAHRPFIDLLAERRFLLRTGDRPAGIGKGVSGDRDQDSDFVVENGLVFECRLGFDAPGSALFPAADRFLRCKTANL